MKRKARIQTGIDDRLVAIYARKSRITNKGDSIGVQFKQSADYAINQLSLPEDYEFARYEDKGLSGYYSDRPDFQRLLRDIEMGKIKAVACYKLDRISRKTSDLMRLLEYFERHDVTLLVCSNNINTRISTSKIIIQVLAIIAEFERDILTERIQDNLMELAKDGRWLGGKTPTGFSSQRVTTGSGKNKSAISFLVPVQEEKEIVLEIYGTFWETRSLLQTANIINEKYETKHGAKFTTSTIRLILRNPIYCVADEYSYNYFLEHDGNLFGEPSDFDGQHGLTAYNKTDQMKVEDEDSTFFNPKFSQLLTRKPISEWIVSVGRHEGFISSRKWVETQNMLDEIAEKYNRPHRKTNALLSGLMYCPICGKRLRVLPESNRWTNGKPRFKYACPGVRAKECTFKGVEGVTLDEFVIHSLSSLQEEHSDYYRQLLENRVASMIRTDQSEKEYQETKKAIERLNADIAAQVRNLREADDALKRFIQDDIKELTDELAKREAALRRMEDTQSENQYLIHELNGMKKRLLSFEEFAKGAQPEALFTLVHSIVDRIYITTDGTKQKCQVYIKGCATEDYSDVLGAAGYIEEEPLLPVASYVPPMCDLDYYSIIYSNLNKSGPWIYQNGKIMFHMSLPYGEVCDSDHYSICYILQPVKIFYNYTKKTLIFIFRYGIYNERKIGGPQEMNKKIAFIGSGNMGSALIRAASRALNPQQIYITDYDLAKASSLARETGCQTAATNADAAGLGDFIFLCVKPQIIGDVLHEISPYLNRQCETGKEKVLISIAAGLTIETLRQKLDGACRRLPFVRIMPNTPAAIGKGMLAMAFGPEVSEDILADLELVLFRAGRIERLSETMMDAFTTVSGCVPAFAYLFIEALADGAVLTGLSRHQALTYAAQAVLGAAAMVLETGRHPGELKDAVCSPKGSTIAGVSALERNGFRSAAIEAITDAYQKNTELGKIG